MLFEVMNQPVPQSDVRQAEREWIKDHGDDLPEPDAGQRLPVRSAWARVNLYRAEYFNMLELWPEAVNSAKSAVAWMPEHAVAWYSLGFALLQQGDHNRASEALLQSVGIDPDISGPRTALASIALNQGDKATARRLLLEELERHPDDPSAQAFWEYMQ
jgi:tetratricopeptide (TPR) repeat protein